jgi:hypothetical protein
MLFNDLLFAYDHERCSSESPAVSDRQTYTYAATAHVRAVQEKTRQRHALRSTMPESDRSTCPTPSYDTLTQRYCKTTLS